jgi:HEPN domain-containing protein
MDNQEKCEDWFEAAVYNIESAVIMYNAGRWLYICFMCQ